jgi:hypothetical protein
MKNAITVLLMIASTAALAEPPRDPMRPPMVSGPARSSAQAPAPAVSAVFISHARRVAVVFGRVVHAGDRVGNCVVDEVVPDGIRCHEGSNIHVARSGAPVVAFRTPATQPTLASNGEKK